MAGLLNVRVFTASTTYTPTAGTVSILIEALGGGGGGGGAASTTNLVSAGGGGGAGGYAIGRVTSGFSGVAITIGAAGAGAAAGANVGSNGGTTSFGSVLSATGGGGGGVFGPTGLPNATYGGAGGVASGSACLNPNATASQGDTAYAITNNIVSGGMGASTIYGGGGWPEENGNATGAVFPGTGYGSGGGGGANSANGILKSAKAGAAGTQGIMIIWEYT